MLSTSYNQDDVEKLKGPSEKDLVYSGLEEIMCQTMARTMKDSLEKNISMRISAYKYAISAVYFTYRESGITI